MDHKRSKRVKRRITCELVIEGKRYSGIVAGCMNTIGNLGGTLAGIATGLILDWHTASFTKGTPAYDAAKHQGWVTNIAIFGFAYSLAVLCWLKFDATKAVAPEENR